MSLPATVAIAVSVFKSHIKGDTIEERFQSLLKPEVIESACFMTTREDEQFRAAVGAVMLSFGAESPEFQRIQAEMQALNQVSALIHASQAGLTIGGLDLPEGHEPIGLLSMWREREGAR